MCFVSGLAGGEQHFLATWKRLRISDACSVMLDRKAKFSAGSGVSVTNGSSYSGVVLSARGGGAGRLLRKEEDKEEEEGLCSSSATVLAGQWQMVGALLQVPLFIPGLFSPLVTWGQK